MRTINTKLATGLLEAGKQEFLEKGFQGASMRSIAASLGVTTGSIYRYYADKEAMFDALVSQPAEALLNRYREVQQDFSTLPLEQKLSNLPEISDGGQLWMMNHIYDHFDAFRLIVCCSSGTRYEHYLETLTEIEANASRSLIDGMLAAGMTVQPLDDELIQIMSSMLFNGMFETVRHDTASVDPENEAELQAAIDTLTRNKTIVMIAHRLKTVRHADQILVLDSGHIVQRGVHEELAAQPGLYADFIGMRRDAASWKLA